MKNKIKLMIFSTVGLSAIAVPSIASFSKLDQNKAANISNSFANKSLLAEQNEQDKTNFLDKKSLDNISTSIGPIVMKDAKTIESRDWYGYANWSFDITSVDKTINGSETTTTVVDWEYLETSDSLFLITSNSYLIKLNATTGEVLASTDKTTAEINSGTPDRIAGISYNDTLYVWDSKTTSTTIYEVDRNTLKKTGQIISSGNSFLTQNRLQTIYPLEVGYNIAITTESNQGSGTNNGKIAKLKATLVDDNMKELVPSTAGNNKQTETEKNVQTIDIEINSTTDGLEWENIYKNSFYRPSTRTTFLFIDNKAYEITLNKNAVQKSNIKEVTLTKDNKIGEQTQQLKPFNSSFIDANNTIVFKRDGDKEISYLSGNNNTIQTISLNTTTNNELKNIIDKDSNNENKLTVYGVPTEANKSVNSGNLIYLVDKSSNFATGFVSNIVQATNFYSNQMQLKLNDSVSQSTLLPSQVSINNFRIEWTGADAINPNNTNAKFIVDDRQGKLSVTLLATRNAWYSQLNSVKTKTHLHFEGTSFMKTSDAIKWASEAIFQSLYGKNTPGQITEELLDKNKDTILPSNNINTNNGYSNITKNFLIVNREDATGKIKIEATVSYTDKYNTTVNYSLTPKEYTIKKASASDYKFEFYGQKENEDVSNGNGESLDPIDINTITDNSALNDLKKNIPSFIDPKPDKLAEAFIKTQDSYPIADGLRNVYIKEKDDTNGTLTIAVEYVGLSNQVKSSFSRKYTGFQTTTTAAVTFKGNKVPRDKVDSNITNIFKDDSTTFIDIKDVYPNYSDRISDEVSEVAQTYSDGISKLAAMGYSPVVNIKHDDNGAQYGYLQVELDYSQPTTDQRKKLPGSFYNKFGLKDGKISQVYIGFLPVSTRFGITLKNYYSQEVQRVVNNYNVESVVNYNDLLKTLDYRGYLENEISIMDVKWNGEKLDFVVSGRSAQYPSVASTYNFTIDWAPKFASIRERNLILAVSLTLAGIGVVAFGIGAYILRKNKIRRLLK
ncbi:hypothetical protein [Malacoplasma iowae]|uniref:hypothetical protein n=1 Tax=Malacoplasma iowae TaxID=2116 RepID=UPI002A18B111|nr:hypothetical protein [Malacoplasma iowae]WPL37420.1 hypothetical protein QX182_02830 [Malacoplasma iowae]